MNVAYWFLLAPVVALDGWGWVDMAKVQRWLPYVLSLVLVCVLWISFSFWFLVFGLVFGGRGGGRGQRVYGKDCWGESPWGRLAGRVLQK